MTTLQEHAPDFAKRVAEHVSGKAAEINGLAATRTPDGTAQRTGGGGFVATRGLNPTEAIRATALSTLVGYVDSLPLSDERVYALAKAQAQVHGDLSEWTPSQKQQDMIAMYGGGTAIEDPGRFLGELAVEARRETLAFANKQIADLEAQLKEHPDEAVERLKGELKVSERVNKALASRLKQLEGIAIRAAENDQIRVRAAELQAEADELHAERARLLDQLDDASNELAAQLNGQSSKEAA